MKKLEFDTLTDTFNFSSKVHINGNGTKNGIKLGIKAGPGDTNQNQFEIWNNAGGTVFGVDEQGNITSNGSLTIGGDLNLNQHEAKMWFWKILVERLHLQ